MAMDYGISLYNPNSISIQCPSTDLLLNRMCQQLRGHHLAHSNGSRVVVATICEENIDVLRELIRKFGLSIEPSALYLIRKLLAHGKINKIQPGAIEQRLGSLYYKLKPFQRIGVSYGVTHRRFFLCDDPGLGKTIQSLAIAEFFSQWPCLIVATKSGVENWINEIQLHLPHRSFTKATDYHGQPVDFIVAKTSQLPELKNAMCSLPVSAMFVDEVHKVKNHRTHGYKNIKLFSVDAQIIGLLSGTPIINRPADLISPLILLRKMNLFGNVKSFGEKYCNSRSGRFGTSYKGSSNLEDLFTRLRISTFIRRTKEDVLPELPAKVVRFIYTDLDNRQEYEKYESEFASCAGLTLSSKLRLLTGLGKLKEGVKWISDFLESDRKLVVFAWHNKVIDTLVGEFGCLSMKGEHSEIERQLAVNKFQTDPNERLFVLNFQVGGTVHTLTAANDILIMELPYTTAELTQAEDRLHRIGQTNSVTCYYMLGRRTIDIALVKLLLQKRSISQAMDVVAEKNLYSDKGQLAA